jgi:hyperosmotically inducible periplasmic protein
MRKSVLSSVLWGSLLAAAPAFAADADDRLESRIDARLEKSKLGHVDVDVENGVATLKGDVASAAEKARAARLARGPGVTRVENQIEIDADKAKEAAERALKEKAERLERKADRLEDKADRQKDAIDRRTEATQDRLEKKADRMEAGAERAGERAEARAERMGERAEARAERTGDGVERRTNDGKVTATGDRNDVIDPLITAKVKTKIVNDESEGLEESEINVDTDKDGVVTLRGTVPTEAARQRALHLARNTDGVRKVVDQLKIGAKAKAR